MNRLFRFLAIKTTLLFLLITFAINTAKAQSYWDKIPAYSNECYHEKDDFGKKISDLRREIKDKLEKDKKATEEKAGKMTNEERMALAMKYQNMKPDEIVKMQNEMMAMTQAQTEFQQLSFEMENQYTEIESEFREEYGKRLGPIEAEYLKLPDGEGTPQWAIKKGEELMAKYYQEYDAICAKYFTSSDAKFKVWLKDFKMFLIEKEIPYTQKLIKSQYAQLGMTYENTTTAELMAVDRYLAKLGSFYSLRKPHK